MSRNARGYNYASIQNQPSEVLSWKSYQKFNWGKDDEEEGSIFKHITKDEVEDDPNHVYSHWHLLPDLLLERIFTYLSVEKRYMASLVCQNWSNAFYFPRVWYTFAMDDRIFTRLKFNLCVGWERYINHHRLTLFLQRKSRHIRTLIFNEMDNLMSLYEFMRISIFLTEHEKDIFDNVKTLSVLFKPKVWYEHAKDEDEIVYGTGGMMLSKLRELMGIFKELETLELKNFLLDGKDFQFMEEVCVICCETLRTLYLINLTRQSHTLLHPGAFINLTTLYISPQNIGEELIQLLGGSKVINMYIVQNKFTEQGRSIPSKIWKSCRKENSSLRVHLITEGDHTEGSTKSKREDLWQPGAPVKSILYDSPYPRMTTAQMMQVVSLYKGDLEVFAHKQLPRFYMPRVFHDRVDSSLLLLVRQCPNIHTLMVREKISTSTVLLIAHTAKNLQYFYVRINAIILKSDWPCSPEWSTEFYTWLCRASASYESMEREVSQILGYPWQALTDKQYKLVNFTVDKQHYMFSS
ncbi:unnamed protein product [Meganyctiphanes norvegica]|uniref:F-box domain-containing protein n=1 Tax=Meganyctiphanes norvegica TaxID=48144 RepID=A0AAV2Q0T4_MEGNR